MNTAEGQPAAKGKRGKKKSDQPAPMSADALKSAMEQNQLPATATEQAIGGREAKGTVNPGEVAPTRNPVEAKKPKSKKAKKPDMRPIPETIHVRHEFVEGEFATMGKQIAAQQQQLDALESEKKSFNSDNKAKSDRVQAEIDRLTNALSSGYVMREVLTLPLVAIDKDQKNARKCFYNATTGEFIKAEPLELNGQLDIFALHPRPGKIEAKLSKKMLQSAV